MNFIYSLFPHIHYIVVFVITLLVFIGGVYFIFKSDFSDKKKIISIVSLIIIQLGLIIYYPTNDDSETRCDLAATVEKVTNKGFIWNTNEYEYEQSVSVGDFVCLKGRRVIRTPYLTISGWIFDMKEIIIEMPPATPIPQE